MILDLTKGLIEAMIQNF